MGLIKLSMFTTSTIPFVAFVMNIASGNKIDPSSYFPSKMFSPFSLDISIIKLLVIPGSRPQDKDGVNRLEPFIQNMFPDVVSETKLSGLRKRASSKPFLIALHLSKTEIR